MGIGFFVSFIVGGVMTVFIIGYRHPNVKEIYCS